MSVSRHRLIYLLFLAIRMENYKDYFKDKKVTVMRIGLLGRGVGDTAYMAEAGAIITVVDDAPQEQMQPSVDALVQYPNVTFKFGAYDFNDFKEADLVLVGAGTPIEEPVLVECKNNGVTLKQSAALFAELTKIPVVGVTGTRGKSTVTAMIHHVLSVVTGEDILLGGNVRGLSNLQLLKHVTPDSLCVMELDSWQLQGWGWSQMSPQIAVFTNFMDDHLNYYEKGGKSREEALELYFADKANIFLYQEESGVLVTTPEVWEMAGRFAAGRDITLGQEVKLVDASVLPEDALLSMPGDHNRLNAALAYEALKSLSLTDEEIFPALASFPGVEGRLQKIGDINGVPIYNDNNATTPAATAAGLKAVANGQNVVLLVGGSDKNLPVEELARAIEKRCVHVILYSGSGTDKLKAALSPTLSHEEHGVFKDAVEALLATSAPGNVALFSPGFASFGTEFRNEYDRHDMFVRTVAERTEN